jgi:acetoin utilization protein AcuB
VPKGIRVNPVLDGRGTFIAAPTMMGNLTGTTTSGDSLPATRQYPVVRQFMTASPHTISRRQSLAEARRLMLDFHVRHLPVTDEGHIVGLVSERDLLLVESLPGTKPTEVRVEEAMVSDVFAVGPDAPIGEIVAVMIARKLGSAVVVEADRVMGVFTTIDALGALHQLLERT